MNRPILHRWRGEGMQMWIAGGEIAAGKGRLAALISGYQLFGSNRQVMLLM
jgi:hypothetical protein